MRAGAGERGDGLGGFTVSEHRPVARRGCRRPRRGRQGGPSHVVQAVVRLAGPQARGVEGPGGDGVGGEDESARGVGEGEAVLVAALGSDAGPRVGGAGRVEGDAVPGEGEPDLTGRVVGGGDEGVEGGVEEGGVDGEGVGGLFGGVGAGKSDVGEEVVAVAPGGS